MVKPKKAIILAAGRGERMRPLTDELPKCLIKIKGKSILINALENLERNGIEETILVVGHFKNKIKKAIGEKLGSMKIIYIDNDLYDKTNNSYSLWLAIKDLNEDLLILEGDIFFEDRLLQEFIEDKRENLTIIEKYNPNLDGTFVEIGDDNSILSWVHKKDRPGGFTLEDKYKTVNIHKFSDSFIKQWIAPILEKNFKEPIESIFNEIIKRGGKIHTFNARGSRWIEVDDANDLKRAKEIFK